MTEILLQTKLYIPQRASGPQPSLLVPRSRLIQKLTQGSHRKMTLVSAPAGFGKTTLVADWCLHVESLSASEDLRFVWVSLDESDNDFVRFYTYLITALRQIDPDWGESTLTLLHSPQATNWQLLLGDLINALINVEMRIGLVLDDYHLITNPDIHHSLEFLLENLPPCLHLVLTTRVDPPFPLARLRGRGQITEIRVEELRFSLDEAAIFLNQLMALNLPQEAISALGSRTEGWAAGLQMAALSMQGRQDISRFIDGFTGSHRYIFDYLAEEVLARRPAGTREFLLQTAVLERMCGPLCNAVLEIDSSQQTLEQLEAANLFLIPLDDQRRWYRYHHLFADLLLQFLRRDLPEQEAVLHGRASRWFEQAGAINEAVEHALKAGDYVRAAALIEPIAHGMAYNMDIYTLGRWIEALPDLLLIQYPGIVYPYAVTLSVTNQFDALRRYLEKVEHIAEANLTQPSAKVILGQVAIQKCINLHLFGEYELALVEVDKTEKLLRRYDQPHQRWELISIRGYSTIHAVGEAEIAMQNLLAASRQGQTDEGSIGVILCNTFTANAHLVQGQLRQAQALLLTAAEAARMPDGTPLPHAPFPATLLARLSYEQNDLTQAEQYTAAYLPLPIVTGFTMDPVDTIFVLVMLPLAQGNAEQALDQMAQAKQYFQALPLSHAFKARFEALNALLQLRLDQLPKAGRWAETVEIPINDSQWQPWYAFVYHVWARIMLAQQRYDSLDDCLARLLNWATEHRLGGIMIETKVLQALSAQAQQDASVALHHLQTALNLAEPEGYTRLFLDEGEAMTDLLQAAVRHKVAPSYAPQLLAEFKGNRGETPANSAANQQLIEPLSPRELEVLYHLAEGYSNQELANTLYISLGTAKRHVANIYGKLGVNNRTQAVARARQLGLMSVE